MLHELKGLQSIHGAHGIHGLIGLRPSLVFVKGDPHEVLHRESEAIAQTKYPFGASLHQTLVISPHAAAPSEENRRKAL